METVTHREMRNNSGALLRRVEAGTSVRISNGGRVTAMLVPASGDAVDSLIERGEARPARSALDSLRLIRRASSKVPSATIIAESRGRW